MKSNVSVCCLSLILLIKLVGAKPVSDLQTLKDLLEVEMNSSEEMMEQDKSLFGAPDQNTWDSSDPRNSVLDSKENLLALFFKDLLRTSKRSWSRSKKGGLRSCFGVRLERIGSFSGLGC